MADSHLDVVIIGAGISGISAAYHIRDQFPTWKLAILEARGAIGGTWDLFRYPGIRTDSDCYTFGFPWHPWAGGLFNDGPSVLRYITDAATTHGLNQLISFHHKVTETRWSGKDRMWTVHTDGQKKVLFARFVIFGTGYYRYEQPLQPDIPGLQRFTGRVVYPQYWPTDIDYAGKKVALIGSGATAISLLPALAETAAHVVLVQRSPAYILPVPECNPTAWLPFFVARFVWIVAMRTLYLFCRIMPNPARYVLGFIMSMQLPDNMNLRPDFCPQYPPWDQRLCVSPDADFFTALKRQRAQIKTCTIKAVAETGILLETGEFVDADIIVAATGLYIQAAGGIKILLNESQGETPCDLPEKLLWNSLMIQDIPNAFYLMGYTNTSWTLGVEASVSLMCRLLRHLEQRRRNVVMPYLEPSEADRILRQLPIALNATNIKAAASRIPKAGHSFPWAPRGSLLWDYLFARYGRLDQGLRFMV